MVLRAEALLRNEGKLTLTDDQRALLKKACEGSRLLDITEFGRAVHAEMDALLSCGRAGIETLGTTLFSTTFPCHNCAKHIVASGVKRVVYIEPYEKSQALDLHDDAIVPYDPGDPAPQRTDLEDEREPGTRIVFEPFMGVGPRRFFDLFSMRLSNGYPVKRKRKPGGTKEKWKISNESTVRVPMLPKSYLEREAQLVEYISTLVEGTP